jgi:Ceramidase
MLPLESIASPWAGLEPGKITFCEAGVGGWVQEPANAYSSVAYIVVAAYLFRRSMGTAAHALALVAVTGLLMGCGSFFFHASRAFVGEFVDEASMFLLSGLMLTLALRRLRAWTTATCVRAYGVLSVVSVSLLAAMKSVGVLVFAVHVLVLLVLEVNLAWQDARAPGGPQIESRDLHRLVATFGAALAIWSLDLTRLVCRSGAHVFNGHAVWHVLTAACLVFYHRYQEQFFSPRRGALLTPPRPTLPAPAASPSRSETAS